MRFHNKHDEYLWQGAIESGVVRFSGSEDSPVGLFAPITLLPEDESIEERAALEFYSTPYLILSQSNEDVVTVLMFEHEADRNRRVSELLRAHMQFITGVTDEDLNAATFGYRFAAEYATDLDSGEYGWTLEAQRVTTEEVSLFVLTNTEDLRVYLAEVKQEWQHAGRQFYRSRNGELGFAQDAAGEVVDRLLAGAQAFGKQRVDVNDEGEIEVAS